MIIKTALRTLPLVVVMWLGVLAGVSLFSDNAPAQLVLFPPQGFIQNLPSGVALVGLTGFSATLTSSQPALAQRLYANGAWLVLPAQLTGCGIGAAL